LALINAVSTGLSIVTPYGVMSVGVKDHSTQAGGSGDRSKVKQCLAWFIALLFC